jgi:hypothetical protein
VTSSCPSPPNPRRKPGYGYPVNRSVPGQRPSRADLPAAPGSVDDPVPGSGGVGYRSRSWSCAPGPLTGTSRQSRRGWSPQSQQMIASMLV